VDGKRKFDYDVPIAGLKAIDRYTVRFTLTEPRPRFLASLAGSSIAGAQAREAVEHYGDENGAHPVGTGPFRLKSWARAHQIVVERNPQYREVLYDAQPAPDDAEGQAILARLKGRRLPLVDEVQVSIIEEGQPRWLAFLNAEIDALASVASPLPPEFSSIASPNGKVAPHLARRGVRQMRTLDPDTTFFYFNMEDPVVGGYTAEKVALRRAISLGYDVEREIRLVRRGQAIPAQSPVVPHTSGYDPAFKSPASEYDPAKARALLDMYGYVDRDGDGFRELPDGSPLTITMSTEPDQIYRQLNEVFRTSLQAIGLQAKFEIQQWAAHLKQAQGGKLQMWGLGSLASDPDGQGSLARLYGPQAGQQNLARFKSAEFDRIYEAMLSLPDGPEREKLFYEAKRIVAAQMPYRNLAHRISTELLHPWVYGYRRTLFWSYWWHLVDVDPQRRPVPA
jgi:ABC-type transport system substrate-binding protein